jgi:hypothetical protein
MSPRRAAAGSIQTTLLFLIALVGSCVFTLLLYILLIDPAQPVITTGGPTTADRDSVPPGGELFVDRTYHKLRRCPGDITVTIDCAKQNYRRLLHAGHEQLDVGHTRRNYRNKIPEDAPIGAQCEIRVTFVHTCILVPIHGAVDTVKFMISSPE